MVKGDFTLTVYVQTPTHYTKIERQTSILTLAKDDCVTIGTRGIFTPDVANPAITHYYPPHAINEIVIRDRTKDDANTKG